MVATTSVPEWPWRIVQRLAEQRSAQVWLVGGAVRDLLLKRPVHDWDFAVDGDALALARTVADALGGAYYRLDAVRGTGRALLTTPDGAQIVLDFARLRGHYLREDLLKRDFTINAMAIDTRDLLLDPTDGKSDLEAGCVRAVGDQAFRDDPLRLLRAVRVAGELGFVIDPDTLDWIRRDASLVAQPAPERVREELMRLIGLPLAGGSLELLDRLGLLPGVIPELALLKGLSQSPPHRLDVWRHTLVTVDTLQGLLATLTGRAFPVGGHVDLPAVAWDSLDQALGRFAGDLRAHLSVIVSGGHDRAAVLKVGALLHDVGKAETWERDADGGIHFFDHGPAGARLATVRLRELRFARVAIERVDRMVFAHLRPAHLSRAQEVTRRAVYRYFRALGDVGVDVVVLSLADHLATWGPHLRDERWARRLEVAQTLLWHYFERYRESVAPPPLLTGRDLMVELGLSEGPDLGRLLEAIREAQAAGEVRTRQEALALARSSGRVPFSPGVGA